MTDTAPSIVLEVPRGALALSAMRVVVGWVASCNDIPLDQLDDINLALETLLAGDTGESGALSLELGGRGGVVEVVLDGLQGDALRANLESEGDFSPCAEWPLDVRLFLGALVDAYTIVSRDSEPFGVAMQKQIG